MHLRSVAKLVMFHHTRLHARQEEFSKVCKSWKAEGEEVEREGQGGSHFTLY